MPTRKSGDAARPRDDAPLAFETAREWEAWLERHHETSDGIWLRIFKKGSSEKTVTYAEALDAALCYGWIDGQKRAFDDASFLQRFTPRRARSVWSKVNTEHVARLTAAGRMRPAGVRAVEAAKGDGRWDRAYAPARDAEPPEDFLRALRAHPEAHAFYRTLNRANVYAIVYRITTAKRAETRERWIHRIVEMLASGETFH
jgi:uncharacterized protein YdeI (YjbR/CyaY-like superfamily)